MSELLEWQMLRHLPYIFEVSMAGLKIYEIDKRYLGYISNYSEHVFYYPKDVMILRH